PVRSLGPRLRRSSWGRAAASAPGRRILLEAARRTPGAAVPARASYQAPEARCRGARRCIRRGAGGCRPASRGRCSLAAAPLVAVPASETAEAGSDQAADRAPESGALVGLVLE